MQYKSIHFFLWQFFCFSYDSDVLCSEHIGRKCLSTETSKPSFHIFAYSDQQKLIQTMWYRNSISVNFPQLLNLILQCNSNFTAYSTQVHWKNVPVATFQPDYIMLLLALKHAWSTANILLQTGRCESCSVSLHWLLYKLSQFINETFVALNVNALSHLTSNTTHNKMLKSWDKDIFAISFKSLSSFAVTWVQQHSCRSALHQICNTVPGKFTISDGP